jgi:hypothetical protein
MAMVSAMVSATETELVLAPESAMVSATETELVLAPESALARESVTGLVSKQLFPVLRYRPTQRAKIFVQRSDLVGEAASRLIQPANEHWLPG